MDVHLCWWLLFITKILWVKPTIYRIQGDFTRSRGGWNPPYIITIYGHFRVLESQNHFETLRKVKIGKLVKFTIIRFFTILEQVFEWTTTWSSKLKIVKKQRIQGVKTALFTNFFHHDFSIEKSPFKTEFLAA